jgi:hypothetical protein
MCFQPFEDQVSTPNDGDALAQQRHQLVVVRLVSRGGVLSHGEVVDASGQVRGRFGDWEALVPILRNWLKNEGVE